MKPSAAEQNAKYRGGTIIEITGQAVAAENGRFQLQDPFPDQPDGDQYFQWRRLGKNGQPLLGRSGPNLRSNRFSWLERNARIITAEAQKDETAGQGTGTKPASFAAGIGETLRAHEKRSRAEAWGRVWSADDELSALRISYAYRSNPKGVQVRQLFAGDFQVTVFSEDVAPGIDRS